MNKTVDLCIIGGGISGLSLAAFASQGLSVCVLEKESSIGGLLQSMNVDGAIFDEAANGWLDSEPAVAELIERIGSTEHITPANTNQSTRYLVHRNALHALSPKLLLRSTPLLSWWSKLRILRELLWSPKSIEEPSMAAFMEQRFGKGVIDNFLAPMCAGIYADKPEHLSIRAAFPNLWQMANQGSILRQLIARLRDPNRKAPALTSLRQGTHQLCLDIAQHLERNGHPVYPNNAVEALSLNPDQTHQWTVYTPNGTVQAKALAITCPANVQADLLDSVYPEIATLQRSIEYSPVAVVLQRFNKSDFTRPPTGFGALLNRESQQSGLLGILFSSHLYPHRCDEHTVMTRSILGGSIAPQLVDESNQTLEEIALRAHRTLFDCPNLATTHVHTIRWERAIPRYKLGHWSLQKKILAFHQQQNGLRLSGNHLFGVAVKDCIRIGKEHAQHFLHTLSPTNR